MERADFVPTPEVPASLANFSPRARAALAGRAAAEKALNLPLTTRDRHRGDLPHLQLTLAWGCVAECIVSILCPVSIVGVLDLSATALNVIGPFIAGVVHAFDESLNDTRWHRYCAAFQAGFVGVFTSYTFMAEQSATLTASHGLLYGGAYVLASMAAVGLLLSVSRRPSPWRLSNQRGRRDNAKDPDKAARGVSGNRKNVRMQPSSV